MDSDPAQLGPLPTKDSDPAKLSDPAEFVPPREEEGPREEKQSPPRVATKDRASQKATPLTTWRVWESLLTPKHAPENICYLFPGIYTSEQLSTMKSLYKKEFRYKKAAAHPDKGGRLEDYHAVQEEEKFVMLTLSGEENEETISAVVVQWAVRAAPVSILAFGGALALGVGVGMEFGIPAGALTMAGTSVLAGISTVGYLGHRMLKDCGNIGIF